MATRDRLSIGLDERLTDVEALYQNLHEHPELSFQEERTADGPLRHRRLEHPSCLPRQGLTPRALRGRISSAYRLIGWGGIPIAALGGVLGSTSVSGRPS